MDDVFSERYFDELVKIEEVHAWSIARRELIFKMLMRFLKQNRRPVEHEKMLEIGCGCGSVLRYLEKRGFRVAGLDAFAKALQYCSRDSTAPLFQADALRTPFPALFSIVGIFDVLEHVQNDLALLKEARRVLAPGGLLVLTVPANKLLWSYFDILSHHKRRYSRTELMSRLKTAGFKVRTLTHFVCSPFPLLLAYRMLTPITGVPPSDLASIRELRMPPGLNSVLVRVLRFEALFSASVGMPFGASLVGLAEKV